MSFNTPSDDRMALTCKVEERFRNAIACFTNATCAAQQWHNRPRAVRQHEVVRHWLLDGNAGAPFAVRHRRTGFRAVSALRCRRFPSRRCSWQRKSSPSSDARFAVGLAAPTRARKRPIPSRHAATVESSLRRLLQDLQSAVDRVEIADRDDS